MQLKYFFIATVKNCEKMIEIQGRWRRSNSVPNTRNWVNFHLKIFFLLIIKYYQPQNFSSENHWTYQVVNQKMIVE